MVAPRDRKPSDGIRRRAAAAPATGRSTPPQLREREQEGIVITERQDVPASTSERSTEEAIRSFFRSSARHWEEPLPRTSRRILWITVISVIALIGLVLATSTVFARFTLTIRPKTVDRPVKDFSVFLNTSVRTVQSAGRVIPAERLEFKKSSRAEFETTGRQAIAEKAKGGVRIYNRFSSSPQILVATTRFAAPDGKLYRLPRTITVPGAKIEEGKIAPQFTETELFADGVGESYNRSGEVNLRIPGFQGGPKYDGFYAVAGSGFQGGFEGEARVVSPEDLRRAEASVTQAVYRDVEQGIDAKLPGEFRSANGLREILITRVDAPQAGSRMERFAVESEARGRILIFRDTDIADLWSTFSLTEGAEMLRRDSARLEYTIRTVDLEQGKAEVAVEGTVGVSSAIPQDEIRQLVREKRSDEIAQLLGARPEIGEFRISVFPPWLRTFPREETRIRLRVLEP